MTLPTSSDDKATNAACSEKDVEAYLNDHPAFFQDNPNLLLELKVPHSSGGAVSLIERQVALLRDENRQLRQRIKDLVEIARENEELVNKLHTLSMSLIAADTLNKFTEILINRLSADFGASHVSVKLFKEAFPKTESNAYLVSRNDKSVKHFENFLGQKTPVCGRFNSQQLAYLFGDKALEVKSLALIPVLDNNAIGMFAIGSKDANHFKASMSTSLLSSLGDVASSVIKQLIR